jgi:hypothetical protein
MCTLLIVYSSTGEEGGGPLKKFCGRHDKNHISDGGSCTHTVRVAVVVRGLCNCSSFTLPQFPQYKRVYIHKR